MRNLSYVSMFSGAGGLDIGLELAGWRTAYASDFDPDAVATLKSNVGARLPNGRPAFAETFIERADIREITAADVLAKASAPVGGVSLLVGGPPCQSWSSAGHQLGLSDPRGRLFGDFLRIADDIDARWLLMENVRGLLTARGPDGQPGSALNSIRRELLDHGYQTAVSLLNAADFGVPQRRVRLIIIGYRSGDVPAFPAPTHARCGGQGRPQWITLAEALETISQPGAAEIIRPTGKLASDLAGIAPGSGVKSPGKAERTRPSGHWGYKQGAFVADLSQSARTVTASGQQDWIVDPVYGLRRLSPRECAAIQGFPPGWRFAGPPSAQYRLIGNAVPPRLAEAIGSALLAHVSAQHHAGMTRFDDLLPLSDKLTDHIRYTSREEASNGASRRLAPTRKKMRLADLSC